MADAPVRFITAWDDETVASGADLIAIQDVVILSLVIAPMFVWNAQRLFEGLREEPGTRQLADDFPCDAEA